LKSSKKLIYLPFFILVLFLFAGKAFPQNGENGELNAEQIITMYKPALVSIWYTQSRLYDYTTFKYTTKDTMLLSGSGFLFSENGLVGTNYHVIEPIDSIIIKMSDGIFYNAEVVLMDEKNDFAILKIKDSDGMKFPTVKLANSDSVRQGQDVYAIGSPLGYEYTISQGIVAGIRENEKVTFYDPMTYMPSDKVFEKVIQITAAISPGNSGGALFSTRGEVIGITSYGYMGFGNLNFAVAINTFKNTSKLIETADSTLIAELEVKREQSIFNKNYKNASNLKSQLFYDWMYTKQKDTMKVYDTLIVKSDSLNKLNYVKAEMLYLKCVDMRPDTFFTYRELLDMYVFTESYDKAEDFYKKIKERFQSDSLINTLSSTLADAYSTKKDYTKALSFYEKMEKVDASDMFIRVQIANIYEKTGDYKKAIVKLNQVIKQDSSFTNAYVQIGRIYYERVKDNNKSKEYLSAAYLKELNTGYVTYPDMLYYLGMIAIQENKKAEAIMYYSELRSSYSYKDEDTKKKADLYKAIQKMDE
jgi:tetratricopeptide (TPR) repeat protein